MKGAKALVSDVAECAVSNIRASVQPPAHTTPAHAAAADGAAGRQLVARQVVRTAAEAGMVDAGLVLAAEERGDGEQYGERLATGRSAHVQYAVVR